jgi:shikimate dehydrogenase
MEWRELKEPAGLGLALVGDPVEHSLSPKMQTAALKTAGIAGEYIAVRVSAEEFSVCMYRLATLGYAGANVTVPHKALAAAIGLADDDIVPLIRAANCLKFRGGILARNTDVDGFLAPIENAHRGQALVLGAGGAAAAAVYGLAKEGWTVRIWSRTNERAADLAKLYPEVTATPEPDPSDCSLIVNATPVGLSGGEMPDLRWDLVQQETTFYDLTYREGPTDFLERAEAIGHYVIDGREMLVEQGAMSFEWWTGTAAPRDVMRHAVGLP